MLLTVCLELKIQKNHYLTLTSLDHVFVTKYTEFFLNLIIVYYTKAAQTIQC